MLYIVIVFFGFCIGSFINALVYRLHEGKPIWRGRSECPHCKSPLRWFELVPIASFIIQKGKCRQCGEKISWQYPIVEIVTAILFLLILNFSAIGGSASGGQYSIFNIQYLANCFLVFVLVTIFVYDLKYGEIPDIITLPAIGIIIILWLINHFTSAYGLRLMAYGLKDLLIAMGVGGGFFLFQYLISRGKWIGGGDIRLGALMGVILGWPNILTALFIAYVLGAGVSVILILLKKKKWADKTPFGTYLTVATFVAMVWGEGIVEWYLGLIG